MRGFFPEKVHKLIVNQDMLVSLEYLPLNWCSLVTQIYLFVLLLRLRFFIQNSHET